MKKILTKLGVFCVLGSFFAVNTLSVYAQSSQINQEDDLNEAVLLLYDDNFSSLEDKFERFADDLSENYPGNQILISPIDSEKTVFEISRIIENVYRDTPSLRGLILLGDIPLPVVNNDEKRFISMLPYTDFNDRSYLFDEESQKFLANSTDTPTKAELWHGVIPADGNSEKLEDFLDKNHDYYENGGDYEEEMFYGDLIFENSSLNDDLFENYQKYLDNLKATSFNQYTKEYASELQGANIESLDTSILSEDGLAFFDSISDLSLPSDIYAKQIYDSTLLPYAKLLSGYMSSVNDWGENTGRYGAASTQNMVKEISLRDEAAAEYIKEVQNDLEDEIYDIVSSFAQDIPLIDYAEISGQYAGGAPFTVNTELGPKQKLYFRFNYLDEVTGKKYVNGVEVSRISGIEDISTLAGSGDGIVKLDRSNNPATSVQEPSIGVIYYMEDDYAVVEDFYLNPLVSANDKYKNPFSEFLQPGDKITKFNGNKISSENPLDLAVKKTVRELNSIKTNLNSDEPDVSDLLDRIIINPADTIYDGNVKVISGVISISYMRGDEEFKDFLTFSIDQEGKLSDEDPQGDPELYYFFDTEGMVYSYNINQNTDAAIFGLNDEKYDFAAGCSKQSDACFYLAAQIPINDKSGAQRITDLAEDFDIDEAIIDEAYFALSTPYAPDDEDSNLYKNVLDPSTLLIEIAFEGLSIDYYGRFFQAVGDFIRFDDDEANPEDVWNIINNLNADNILLSDDVPLSMISNHYGLFDGVDNDGDGVLDENDMDEASPIYGLDSENLKNIYRKIFSKQRVFSLSKNITGLAQDISITVKPHFIKDISSLINHNEPRNTSILNAYNDLGGADLPIDYERYLAFIYDGQLEKVDYPDLFSFESEEELEGYLNFVSTKLAVFSGANIPLKTNEYLSKLKAKIDFEKLNENSNWLLKNINQKHAYILENLEQKSYEFVYLALDGDKDFISLNFSENTELEGFENLEILEDEIINSNENITIPLYEYGEEISRFVNSFSTETSLKNCCSFAEDAKNGVAFETQEEVDLENINLNIDLSKNIISSKNGESVVTVYFENEIAEIVDLDVEVSLQVEDFNFYLRELSVDKKLLADGKAEFNLKTNENAKSSQLAISAEAVIDGHIFKSPTKYLRLVDTETDVITYTFYNLNSEEAEVLKNLQSESEGEQEGEGYKDEANEEYSEQESTELSDLDDTSSENSEETKVLENAESESSEDDSEKNNTNDFVVLENVSDLDDTSTEVLENLQVEDESEVEQEGEGYKVLENAQNEANEEYSEQKSTNASDMDDTSTKVLENLQVEDESEKNSTNDFVVLENLSELDGNSSENSEESKVLENSQGEAVVKIIDELENLQGEDVVKIIDDYEKNEGNEEMTWQEYFVKTRYYDLYLDSSLKELSYETRRLFASVFSDISAYTENMERETSNSMTADNESIMQIDVLLDEDDQEIRIYMPDEEEGEESIKFISGNTARTENGKASFFIQAGKKSKVIDLVASPLSSKYPSENFQISLLPKSAKVLDAKLDLPENINSEMTTLYLTAYDENMNIALGHKTNFDVYIDGILNTITTLNGEEKIEIEADQEKEIIVYLNDDNSYKKLLLKGYDKDEIEVSNLIYVSEEDENIILAETVFENFDYQGELDFKISDSDVAVFENEKDQISLPYDDLNLEIYLSGIARKFYLEIWIGDNLLKSIELEVLPKKSESISLSFDEKTLKLTALLKDKYGNTNYLDNETEINLKESNLNLISENPAISKNGKVEFRFENDKAISNGIFSVSADEIEDTSIKAEIKNPIQINIDSLYLSLMGADFSDLAKEILFENNVQAISTIDNHSNYETLAYIKDDEIEIYSDNLEIVGSKILDTETDQIIFNAETKSFESEKYSLKNSFSDYSSDSYGKAFIIVEKTNKSQSGFGFENENKFALLFAAGNSVGESTLHYFSDSLINYGDPMVKLKPSESNLTGFNTSIGEQIISDYDAISKLLEIDFDADGDKDVLSFSNDNTARILIKNDDQDYLDLGKVLKTGSNIFDATAVYLNDDDYEDLIISNIEECIKGQACIQVFINENGVLKEDNNFILDISEKIKAIKAEDLNNDGCDDLVVSDFSGKISMFFNECYGFSEQADIAYQFDYENGIDIEISKNFDDLSGLKDEYADIWLKGSGTYIYSVDKENYKIFKKSITSTDDSDDVLEEEASVDDLVELYDSMGIDADNDGLPDSWNTDIENTILNMGCSGGGCLANPYNTAFFAPNSSEGNAGLAAFSLHQGSPYIYPQFFTPASNSPNSFFRLYISPTTTMGIGTAMCFGPGTVSPTKVAPCFTYALPVEDMGLCPDITGSVDSLIESAKEVSISPDIGMSTVVVDGQGEGSSYSYTDADSPISISGGANVKIPGFPSSITDWLDNQTNEIFDKLLDLPDLYFIYPDFSTLYSDELTQGTDYSQINNMHDLLRAINSVPLIKIENKDIVLKIPAISEAEIERFKRQAELWIEYEKKQIENISIYWQCDQSSSRKTLCDAITLELGDLILNIEAVIDKLDLIANLPQDILTWKTMEQKYASQIICYMDAIMEYTSGYLDRQTRIADSWMKTIEKVIRVVKSWKAIMDLSIEYQASCDECKTDRFGDLGILLSSLVEIPEPPIIELPKWPDIVLDISEMQTGVRILWPNIKFSAEKIDLPDLPTITLPQVLPQNIDFVVSLEGLGFENLENFELPSWVENFPELNLLLDLPDLPALPLPNLPDLPRPPEIPEIPNFAADFVTNIKPIMQLLCLLKKGLIPVPEGMLATEIETLTQPSVEATLPFTFDLKMKSPAIEYDFLRKIVITVKTSFAINTEFIYDAARNSAEIYNGILKNFVEELNEFTTIGLQGIIDGIVESIETEINEAVIDGVEVVEEGVEEILGVSGGASAASLASGVSAQNLAGSLIDEGGASAASAQDIITLKASTQYIENSDPSLKYSVDEIKERIADRDESLIEKYPNYAYMQDVRDSLISYVDSNEIVIEKLSQGNEIRFNDLNNNKLIADSSFETIFDTSDVLIKEDEYNLFDNMIAQALGDEGGASAASSASDASAQNTDSLVGLFIEVDGISARLIDYNKELNKRVEILNTEDRNILYSLNGDLFYKKSKENLGKEKTIFEKKQINVEDYSEIDVRGVQVKNEGHKKADIFFQIVGDIGDDLYIEIFNGDTFSLDPEEKSISLELENGSYRFRFVSESNDYISETYLLSASICYDDDSPFPVLSSNNFKSYIYKSVEIDVGQSFDSSGEITEYSVINDENTEIHKSDFADPLFEVGPFINDDVIKTHSYSLLLKDQSGNSSSQTFTVEVSVPEIVINDFDEDSDELSGYLVPALDEIPLNLIRERLIPRATFEGLKYFKDTKQLAEVISDENGEFTFDGFDLDDMILVENSDGEIVAEINPETGNIEILEDGYYIEILTSNLEKDQNTEIVIKNDIGLILASIVLKASGENEINIFEEENLEELSAEQLSEVNLSDLDLNDQISINTFDDSAGIYENKVYILDESKNEILTIIDNFGNIKQINNSISFELKENNHAYDPLIIRVKYEGRAAADVFIKPGLSNIKSETSISAARPLPLTQALVETLSKSSNYYFNDVHNSSLESIANDLYSKNIISAEMTDSGLILNGQEIITRAEFVKTLLKMLCIEPRPESYQAYNENEGFYDINVNDKYFPYIKEADLRGLIDGYTGESNENGLHPFKADQSISRVEAAKIIMSAVEMQGRANIESISVTKTAWYLDFLKAAVDFEPYYIISDEQKVNFILTPNEAKSPNKALTRAGLLILVDRALNTYNCFEIDDDGDQMSDYCEEKYNIDDANADPDNDGYTNLEECENNTDPLNPETNTIDTDNDGLNDEEENALNTDANNSDSDQGGASDLSEINSGTDPLDPNDDFDAESNTAGIFIVPPVCMTCPCPSTFLHKSDIISGDKLFAIISSESQNKIYQKSNEIEIN